MARWPVYIAAVMACLAGLLYDHRAASLLRALGLLGGRGADHCATSASAPDRVDQWDVKRHLGGDGPWIRKVEGAVDSDVSTPAGCRVDQVHMMSRNAEQYPSVEAGIRMLELYQRIANAATTLNGSLAFANEWNFFTGDPTTDFDNLVSTGPHAGTSTAFNTGVELRTMYKHLLDSAPVEGRTVLWASDSGLVIATAQYLSAGFFGLDWEASADLHVVSEAPDLGADSLTPGKTCFNHADGAYDDGYRDVAIGISQFKHSYLGTIRESMSKENSDFPLSLDEIYTMQEICGFETIALGRSKWCDVFDNEEWASFEYARDLLHFYQSGPGNPYGATMGWPWLNATANLLLDGPDKGSLFFSFVHDASVVSLLAALDLLPQTPHLPTSHIMTNRTWRMSDVVPMGGRIIFERLACPATQRCWTNAPLYPNHIYCEPIRIDHFVRINVNDAIIAVPGCDAGPGGSCELSSFLEMVARRGVEVGDFAEVCGLPGDAARAITFLHQ